MANTIAFLLPGLPGEDGRVGWTPVEAKYVSGRSLSAYLLELDLPHELLSHVVIDGRAIEPSEMVTVPVPETKWQRRWWRKLRRKPAPTVEVSALDAYIPARGAVIHVIPNVATKNRSLALGIIGGVIGVGVMVATGGAAGLAGWKLAAAGFKAFMVGSAIGSTVGALTTPRPKLIKDQDGPSSYVWNGIGNDDRAGIPEPLVLGERLVGGVRIGLVRRRGQTVPVRTSASDWTDGASWNESEKLHLLVLVAAHKTEGPVGKTNANVSLGASGTATASTSNPPDIRINGQHFANFSGVKVHWRTGAAGQTVIPGFDVVANTYDMSVNLTELGAGTWHTYTTASDQVDAFEVLFTIPGLSHTSDSGGLEKNRTSYKLEYRKVGDSTWLKFDDVAGNTNREITAKQRTNILETRRVSGLPRGRYEIRASWNAADHQDAAKDQWHVFLTGVTEETQQAINYEGCSLVAVEAVASDQLSGPAPTVTQVWRGYIPAKWNGSTFLAPSWGVGTAAPAGRNPFWLALALMRDKDVGAGNEIADSDIDLAQFKTAAEYADDLETVQPANGASYTEPRFQFDAYIDQSQNTLDLLAQIFGTCRAAVLNSGNKWGVGLDRPGTITQYFGMGSIVAGSFAQQLKSERHEINCFDATFDDRAAEWETDSHTECIDNRDPITATGNTTNASAVITGMSSTAAFNVNDYVTVSAGFASGMKRITAKTSTSVTLDENATLSQSGVTLYVGAVFATEDDLVAAGIPVLRRQMGFWGVTRRSQVAREIRFALRQTYALRKSGSFVASTKSILCQAYDLIGISHDVPQWGYSGRVREGSEAYTGAPANLVMFDREVPLESGTTYQVRVHFKAADQDGKDFFEIGTVADGVEPVTDSEYFGVTVTSPFSRIPAAGDEWFYGPVGQEVQPARIFDIDRDENDHRTISWAENNASIYDVSGPIVIPNYSLLPDLTAAPGAITNLTAFVDYKAMGDGSRRPMLVIQWTPPKPSRTDGLYKGAKLEYSDDQVWWNPIVQTDGSGYEWPSPPSGATIYIRATPYSVSGKYNHAGAKVTEPVTIPKYAGAPPDLGTIEGGYADGAFWLSWADLGAEFEYEIRDQNPSNWTTDQVGFIERVRRNRFFLEAPAARNITFYVRARDRFENYATTAVSKNITDTAPAAPTINSITRFKDSIKINVSPPGSTPDIVAIHLHASQTPGFTPSYANRVGNPVGPNGGDFFFRTGTTGTWYFKATCEDWLSQRMADWIYTNQQSDSIVVIQPVNPSGVNCTLEAAPADGQSEVRDIGDGRGPALEKIRPCVVTWTHTDATNPAGSITGYTVTVYPNGGSITDPLYSASFSDPAQRRAFIKDPKVRGHASVIAAVRADYADGITSDYVTSSGLTIPQETNPRIRNSDDRNAAAYAESFDSASLPTGITIANSTYSLSNGEIAITKTGSTVSYINWDVKAWADAYLDTKRTGPAVAIIRCKIPAGVTPTNALTFITTNSSNVSVDIIADGNYHTYRVPIGSINSDMNSAGFQIDFQLTCNNGVTWYVTAVCVAFENFDQSLDGFLDRALRARDQFGKDPTGLGLYLGGGIRSGAPNGDVMLIQDGGQWFLRNEGGSLITETPYKLGRQGRVAQYTNGADIRFDLLEPGGTSSNWGLTVKIPRPASFNKGRMIIQDIGNVAQRSDFPASTTIYRWFEACNFMGPNNIISVDPLFQIMGMYFYGGSPGRYTVAGPWTSSAQAKSALSLSATNAVATDATNDAWYYVEDDGGSLQSAIDDWYYRIAVWIGIQMPTTKKANGSYYYADLDFTVRVGEASTSGSQMDLDTLDTSNRRTVGPYRVRLLTDGRRYIVPIVVGNHTGALTLTDQNVKVDWHGQAYESGGSGTISCEIDRIEWDYIFNTDGDQVVGTSIGVVWVEEYGG